MADLDDIELRAKVTRFLVENFGPIGMRHYSVTTSNILLDKFAEIADEVIKIVDEGRIK